MAPNVTPKILKNLFSHLPNIPINKTDIKEVILIKNPAQPAELKSNVLKAEETKRTTMPEGIPEIRVAKKIGTSEKSSFKKGKTGKIESRPKYPSNKVVTINIELYVILRVLFIFIYISLLTYTKY